MLNNFKVFNPPRAVEETTRDQAGQTNTDRQEKCMSIQRGVPKGTRGRWEISDEFYDPRSEESKSVDTSVAHAQVDPYGDVEVLFGSQGASDY